MRLKMLISYIPIMPLCHYASIIAPQDDQLRACMKQLLAGGLCVGFDTVLLLTPVLLR